MGEKRSEERLKSTMKVDVCDPLTKKVLVQGGHIRNISRGGLSILLEGTLNPQRIFRFKIYLDYATSIELDGKIIDAKRDSTLQVSRVKFESLSMGQKIALNRHLLKHVPAIRSRLTTYSVLCAGAIFFLVLKVGGASVVAAAVASLIGLVGLLLFPIF